ncbi:hypothetical protein ACFXAE_14495 [Streptomyces sp. NPDC059454]|uniref:hypothetical protein n=1 Tax=Streptomyces sp. NPDC059454 TaxID=3346836 RepID=UPI0036B8BFD6
MHPSLVAGVDGAEPGLRAVDRAADEAALSDAPADVEPRRHTVEGPARRVLLAASQEAGLPTVGRRRPGRLGRVAPTAPLRLPGGGRTRRGVRAGSPSQDGQDRAAACATAKPGR